MGFNRDVQKLAANGQITLYELDATKYGGPVFRFHSYNGFSEFDLITAAGNPLPPSMEGIEVVRENLAIIWQGEEYFPIPIDVGDIEVSGKASAVKLTVSNTLNDVVGAFSAYCKLYSDFTLCPFKVITTFAKYLDAANFINGNDQAAFECQEQIWYVNQKTSENLVNVAFELSDPTNLTGRKIPMRDITSYCSWALRGLYRSGDGCTYTGSARFDEDDNPTDDPSKDKCAGRKKSCDARFGDSPKPFGGFVAANIVPR